MAPVSRPHEPAEHVLLTGLSEADLRARRSLKWSTYPADVLPLWVAEMDYPTASPVIDAIEHAVRDQRFGYPTAPHAREVAVASAEWCASAYGWPVDPDRVHVVGNVMHGIRLALRHLCDLTGPVIVTTPGYHPFFDVVPLGGGQVVEVPMATDGGGTFTGALDLRAIDAAFSAGARTLLLCHPYNPLGRELASRDLVALAEIVSRHGGRVISDEIHAPLVYTGVHVPYALSSPAAAEHTVTIGSASKAWNLPGLMCATVTLSNERDAATWRSIGRVELFGASSLGMAASAAAYREGGPWLEAVKDVLRDNIATVDQAVARWPGVRWTAPDATYLGWLDLGGRRLDEDPAALLLREAKVALSSMAPFHAPPHRAVRINLATTPVILDAAIERLDGVLGTAAVAE